MTKTPNPELNTLTINDNKLFLDGVEIKGIESYYVSNRGSETGLHLTIEVNHF